MSEVHAGSEKTPPEYDMKLSSVAIQATAVGATLTAAIRAASELEGEIRIADPLSCTACPIAVDLIMLELHVPVMPETPEP